MMQTCTYRSFYTNILPFLNEFVTTTPKGCFVSTQINSVIIVLHYSEFLQEIPETPLVYMPGLCNRADSIYLSQRGWEALFVRNGLDTL